VTTAIPRTSSRRTPDYLHLGGQVFLAPRRVVRPPGRLVLERSLPDAHFFGSDLAWGSLQLFEAEGGYKVRRTRGLTNCPEDGYSHFMRRDEDPYEVAALVRDGMDDRRDLPAVVSELKTIDIQGDVLSTAEAARWFPTPMETPPAPKSPAWVRGYELLDGRVFATSGRDAERNAAALHTSGYTARLDLDHPKVIHPLYATPPDAERFHIRDGGTPTLEQAGAACHTLDAWLQEGRGVVVNCLAGLGRTGTILACYLVHRLGHDAESAIDAVRRAASDREYFRPVENDQQEDFVALFARARRQA